MMLAREARRWVDVTLGRAAPADEAEQRVASVVRGAASAAVARGISVLASFAIVPLSIGYLGAERYGAWVTIATVIGWLHMGDLGIGNGVTNAIADAVGRREHHLVPSHVATAFWTLAGIASLIGAAAAVAWPFISWGDLFHVADPAARAELRAAAGLALALFLACFPFAVVDRVYAAHGEGAIGNAWATVGSVAAVALVYLATRTRSGLVGLVLASSGAQAAVAATSAAWLFLRHRPELRPRWRHVATSSVSRVGGQAFQFFLLQLVALVMFGTDNVIIARVLGAAQVTPYSVTWSVFSIPALLVGLYAPYLQPMYAQAAARRDVPWILRTLRRTVGGTALVTLCITFPLVLWGRPIIRWWAGAAAVPPPALLWWMAASSLILAPAGALACMLNGLGQIRLQIAFGAVAALVNVALSILLARTFGVTGVIAATVLSYAVCSAVPAALDTVHVLRRLRAAPA